MNPWLLAVRPKTLVAGAAPVLIATSYVWSRGTIDWATVPFTFACAVLIQIASNFVNELEDFKRGADAKRLGPTRAVSAGLISPGQMLRASIAVIAVAFVLGMPLVVAAGWPVLAIGVACLAASWLYTGGPFPLAYHGLGEPAAFLFFGVAAVMGTVFVHEHQFAVQAFELSLPSGLLAACILMVNNIRDVYTDAAINKNTLVVRIGPQNAKYLYIVWMLVAITAVPVLFYAEFGSWILLPLVALPMGLYQGVAIMRSQGEQYNKVLANTAVTYLLLSVLTATGFVLASYD